MLINKYLKCFSGVNTINIDIFMNGKPLKLNECDDQTIDSIEKSIASMWTKNKNSAVWFEVNTYEYGSFFQIGQKEKRVEMQIECFTYDKYNIIEKKKKIYLPRSYIRKFVSESGLIKINPNPVSKKYSNNNFQVKFYIKA